MTTKQKQQRRMATPRTTKQQQATREQYLLAELQKIGYRVVPTGRYRYFIERAAA